MKINWGTGIVLAFIGFISFILYFVITMNVDKNLEHDLVIEDYYKQELTFQDDLNKIENAKNLSENISYKVTEEGLVIVFPKNFDSTKITGKVFLYRPSNKQLDFVSDISLSENYLLIPDKRLVDGRWNITVDWKYNNELYLYKETINY